MSGLLDIFGANKVAKAQTRAAEQSAKASQYATDQSLALQRELAAQARADTQGVRNLGNAATSKLQGLIDGTVDPTAFVRSTAGYQVGLDQGQRQINASAAAKGNLLSGAAAREGLRFGQDYAVGTLNNERNALMGAAGLGMSGVNTVTQAGSQAANASQNALTRNADNLASSYGQKADATAGLWGTISGNFGQNAMARYGKMFAGGF